jgi:ATP-dependent exoDNAse (exonuclease V) beta subunit
MLGNSKANAEMKRASDRGTAVHEMCEKFLNNEELNTRVYDVSYVKLFNQLKLAMKRVDNIRMLEGSLWSDDLEAAGTVDCVCDFDGVLSIVDFKTSNNFKTEKMIFDYFLQETFYALCYGERTGEYPQQIVTLMCSEKGFLPLVWVKTIDDYVEPLIQRISEFHKKYGQN